MHSLLQHLCTHTHLHERTDGSSFLGDSYLAVRLQLGGALGLPELGSFGG